MGHLRIKRWPWVARWPGGQLASWPGHSSRLAESGRLVRRMSHHVDPAANAEEARTVRLDAVLGPPRRSVPVGDISTPESRTLTRQSWFESRSLSQAVSEFQADCRLSIANVSTARPHPAAHRRPVRHDLGGAA